MEMKVAYILNSTLPNSGATKAFISMINGLTTKGVSPLVIVPDQNGVYNYLLKMGIDIHVIRFKNCTYPNLHSINDAILFLPRILGRMWLNIRAVCRLKNILKSYHVQLVHSNVSVVNIGLIAARALNIPHITHFREYADLDFNMKYFPSPKRYYATLAQNNSYSICITKGIMRHHQLSRVYTRVIYDGVKTRTDAMPIVNKKGYYLYAGRVEPTKGLLKLLEAYQDAKNIESNLPPLKVLGAFENKKYLEDVKGFIQSHHLNDSIEILGEKENIDTYMQQAQAIIIPSLFEGFGLCMAEAMFNGCIVVGYNNAGSKEQFENGQQLTGSPIGFPYQNLKELSRLLISLSAADDTELMPIRQRAFHTVNKLYSVEANSQSIYDFYQEILKANSSK